MNLKACPSPQILSGTSLPRESMPSSLPTQPHCPLVPNQPHWPFIWLLNSRLCTQDYILQQALLASKACLFCFFSLLLLLPRHPPCPRRWFYWPVSSPTSQADHEAFLPTSITFSYSTLPTRLHFQYAPLGAQTSLGL